MSRFGELRATLTQRAIADLIESDPVLEFMREHSDRFDPPHTLRAVDAQVICHECGQLPDA